MPERHRPRRGSLGYSPRKRAKRATPRIRSWPDVDGSPKIQGFAGYKVGMTHVIMIDDRPGSLTEGVEISVPVTIVETPPLQIDAVRAYGEDVYGKKVICEAFSGRPSEKTNLNKIKEMIETGKVKGIRIMASTSPNKVSGIPKRIQEILEIGVGGSDVGDCFEYAQELLGKEIKASEVFAEGEFIDVAAITKGKGTQGPVKRWGTMIQFGKALRSSKGRHIGTLGPWNPHRVRWTVPQLGQTGYHQRTEYNKRILKISDDGAEVVPAGGFLNYGVVRNEYLMIKGSIPGPSKRLIRIRPAIRSKITIKDAPDITYISTASKQGV
ncbi:MAG: 50S ribosomal protein L3 [Halobacteriota archaeon]|nr:50S ribosomal protein L3 [Halobacteriota archaeon]